MVLLWLNREGSVWKRWDLRGSVSWLFVHLCIGVHREELRNKSVIPHTSYYMYDYAICMVQPWKFEMLLCILGSVIIMALCMWHAYNIHAQPTMHQTLYGTLSIKHQQFKFSALCVYINVLILWLFDACIIEIVHMF